MSDRMSVKMMKNHKNNGACLRRIFLFKSFFYIFFFYFGELNTKMWIDIYITHKVSEYGFKSKIIIIVLMRANKP